MIDGFDHIVLAVADTARTCAFYSRHLGMTVREERPGKFALHFGPHKISLQPAQSVPDIARNTAPGSANFCLLTRIPVADLAARLTAEGVVILEGPARRDGATGPLLSIYFHDPDGNLVEVSNPA